MTLTRNGSRWSSICSVRGRAANGAVGVSVIFRRTDGTVVLVDRGRAAGAGREHAFGCVSSLYD